MNSLGVTYQKNLAHDGIQWSYLRREAKYEIFFTSFYLKWFLCLSGYNFVN